MAQSISIVVSFLLKLHNFTAKPVVMLWALFLLYFQLVCFHSIVSCLVVHRKTLHLIHLHINFLLKTWNTFVHRNAVCAQYHYPYKRKDLFQLSWVCFFTSQSHIFFMLNRLWYAMGLIWKSTKLTVTTLGFFKSGFWSFPHYGCMNQSDIQLGFTRHWSDNTGKVMTTSTSNGTLGEHTNTRSHAKFILMYEILQKKWTKLERYMINSWGGWLQT